MIVVAAAQIGTPSATQSRIAAWTLAPKSSLEARFHYYSVHRACARTLLSQLLTLFHPIHIFKDVHYHNILLLYAVQDL